MVADSSGKTESEKRAEKVNQERNIRVATTSDTGRKFLQQQAANANLDELRELSRQGVGRDVLAAGIQQGIADRARQAQLSGSQKANLTNKIISQEKQIARIQQSARDLEQQKIAQQAKIKVSQLSKKNERILKELEAIEDAKKRLAFTNTPKEAKAKLRANFQQKKAELTSDLNRNLDRQSSILSQFESKSISLGTELTQRKNQQQQPTTSTSSKSSTSGSSIFGPSSIRDAESRGRQRIANARPETILQDVFGPPASSQVRRTGNDSPFFVRTDPGKTVTEKRVSNGVLTTTTTVFGPSSGFGVGGSLEFLFGSPTPKDPTARDIIKSAEKTFVENAKKNKEGDAFDVLEGFGSTLAERGSILFKTFPQAVFEEATLGFGAGEKRLAKDTQTFRDRFGPEPALDSILSGREPQGSNKRISGSLFADAVLVGLPAVATKGITGSIPKGTSVKNTVKTPKSKGISADSIRIQNNNSIPLDILAADTARPVSIKTTRVSLGTGIGKNLGGDRGFSSTFVNLGRGPGTAGGGVSPASSGLGFFAEAAGKAAKKSKTRKVTTIDDIVDSLNKRDSTGSGKTKTVTDPNTGLQQIVKTKQKTATKTKQKTAQKQQQKQETESQRLTREFFDEQSQSAKKRQKKATSQFEQVTIAIVNPQRQKPEQGGRFRQDQGLLPLLAPLKQDSKSKTAPILEIGFAPIQNIRQRQSVLIPTTSTKKTTTTRIPPIFPGLTTTVIPPTTTTPPPTTRQPPRRSIVPGAPFRLPFEDFSFAFSVSTKKKLRKRFDLNTLVSADSPLSSAPSEFGFGIITTRSNQSLEDLDRQFVKASRKKSRSELGKFSFADSLLLDVSGEKGINLTDFNIFDDSPRKTKPRKTKNKRKSTNVDFLNGFEF